jgi:subtilisin family serine protease
MTHSKGRSRLMNRQISFKGRLRLLIMFIMITLLAVAAVGSLNSTANASYPSKSESAPSVDAASKISPAVLQDTAGGKTATFLVLMADQANVTSAYAMANEDARGWYVYDTLRLHADRTQAGIRAMLQARGATYKSYWISNALVVTGDRSLVESIAARSDVSKIEANRPFKAIDPIRHSEVEQNSPRAIEWGVQNVRAPQVWAMGYTGQGIVVGNADTGMRWTHNAIKPNYRGWNGATADHNHNWWDGIRNPTPGNPCGLGPSREPCDDDEVLGGGHGTHTTGSVLGDDGMGNQIGVAPGAKWIGCRNLDRGVGYPVSYLECFQFFLAPHDLDGNNPDPTRRPHVENNSWACVEGCAGDILRPAVENSQAAGIFIEVSAGNDGPACSTIAWEPQIFEASFDTGAYDINNTLAYFSSRGPVVRDGSGRLKPNVSAPGVDVRSSLRGSDTAYGELSGTSMAGPHTVGVVALLWSARPDLSRRITETKTLLQQSANPNITVTFRQTPDCGNTPPTQIPNNYFGWGRVDALAALQRGQATITPMPTVTALPTFTAGTPGATITLPPIFTSTPTVTSTAIGGTTTAIPTSSSVPTSTSTTITALTATQTSTSVATATQTVAASATPSCTVTQDYQIVATTGATIVPGTSYVAGSTCNSCTVQVALPFSYSFYGTPYSQVNVSNKGVLQFLSMNSDGNNTCLPSPSFNDAIFAYWDDHNSNINDTMGIFISVSGTAPNRIFNIEWRSGYVANDIRSRYEVRLYEGQPKFEVIYGQTRQGFSATVGVQKGTGERFTQYACDVSNSVPNGTKLTFDQRTCPGAKMDRPQRR